MFTRLFSFLLTYETIYIEYAQELLKVNRHIIYLITASYIPNKDKRTRLNYNKFINNVKHTVRL